MLKENNGMQTLYENIIKLSQLDVLESVRKIGERSYTNQNSLPITYYDIADFLLKVGQPDVAEMYYKLSLNAAFTPTTYSGYLQCLLLNPSCTAEKMFAEASKYSQFFKGIQPYETYSNDLRSDRKLNIGYICHFFHNSVSQSILLPFVKAHNRDQVKVFCYSDTLPDEVADDVKSIADVWRDTKTLDDETLAQVLREDKIDILLELNGHCAINRYGVIARKPVPVQVSFYNISTTSGVPGFDYILVGDEISLGKLQSYYSESFYFMKGAGGVAEFPDYFPDAAPAPCLKNGYITFGSFGSAHKVNAAVIKLWCKVLKEIPTAKFYMKAGVLIEEHYKQVYLKQFVAEGIDPDRIYLEGYSEHQKMLECYANMDIALDTFPHAAGTTTLEALWQGVPVLTLSGETYSMQHGKVILGRINHSELVSYSEEEFVSKAVALAKDQERIVQYRQSLREDFKNSPCADVHSYVTNLENAYMGMWSEYCKNNNDSIKNKMDSIEVIQ